MSIPAKLWTQKAISLYSGCDNDFLPVPTELKEHSYMNAVYVSICSSVSIFQHLYPRKHKWPAVILKLIPSDHCICPGHTSWQCDTEQHMHMDVAIKVQIVNHVHLTKQCLVSQFCFVLFLTFLMSVMFQAIYQLQVWRKKHSKGQVAHKSISEMSNSYTAQTNKFSNIH